jgi:hypothetical protein
MSLDELAGPLTDLRTNGRGLGLEQLHISLSPVINKHRLLSQGWEEVGRA